MAYFKPKMLEARIYVGSKGDFETLKEAVDWFNANATANTEILLDGGDHLINDTVTVNNGSYYLQIRGLGSSVTYLNAATVGGTALTGKPMFDLRTDCDMNKFSAQAATLAGYGTASGENFMNFTTNASKYHEIKDFFIYGFHKGFVDSVGTDIFLFDFVVQDSTATGLEVNHTGTGSIDIEIGNIINCPTAINLVKASTNEDVLINGVNFVCSNPSDICIKYDGTQVVYDTFSTINNNWNQVGEFRSGIDFKRRDGRDADIEFINNIGEENKTAHAKINVLDNTTAVTCTDQNTYYAAAGLNSKTRIVFDAAATSGTFTITVDDQTTGDIAWNAAAATIETALEGLSNVTNCTVTQVVASKEWTIEFLTAGEGWVTQSVDVRRLGTTTSAVVTHSFYTTKLKLDQGGKVESLTNHTFDAWATLSGNLQTNQNGQNINIALRKNNSTIISPLTVRAQSAGVPYGFAVTAYLEDVKMGDYFEVVVANTSSAGRTVTLQDMTMFFNAR